MITENEKEFLACTNQMPFLLVAKSRFCQCQTIEKGVPIKISKKNEKLHSQFVGVPLNCPMENHFRFINCLETTLKNNDFALGKISFKSEIPI